VSSETTLILIGVVLGKWSKLFLMTQLYLRLMLIPTALFTAALLLIRTQPYDNPDLHQLLLPDGCPAPCFIGIRPGVTTSEETLKLLEASQWIGEIDNSVIDNEQGFIRWDWSDHKPNWISANTKGKIWIAEHVVETITLFTDFRLGETQLVLGLPEGELVDPTQNRSGTSSLYTAFYNQKGLLLRIWQPCGVVEPYRRSVIVTYTVQSEYYHYPYRNWLSDVFTICSNQNPQQ
jgi:hypothetical protein